MVNEDLSDIWEEYNIAIKRIDGLSLVNELIWSGKRSPGQKDLTWKVVSVIRLPAVQILNNPPLFLYFSVLSPIADR